MVSLDRRMINIVNVGTKFFGKDKEKFNKLQQEQRDLDASYQQSKLNKKERDDKEE